MTHDARLRTTAVVAVLTVAGATLACDRPSMQVLEAPAQAPLATPKCLNRDAPDYYFAPGQIRELDDAFMRRSWFRRYLVAAGAESLSCGEPKEAYRVLWLPASRNAKIFTIRPVASEWRMEIVDFGKELFLPELESNTPHELARSTRDISQPDLRRIQQELELIGFWSAQQHRHNLEVDDGYALVIEGRSGNNYRAITRINVWDGAEQVACPLFDIARIMLPDPIRCARPVTVP